MTELLDIYREFVHHRQETLIAKLKNPSHVSPVLGTNKFTNVQRVFDRVSQYELKNVLYAGNQDPIEILKRIFLFDQTKTEQFWDIHLDQEWNFYSTSFDIDDYWENQHQPKEETKNFTNAYMIPGKQGEDKLYTVHKRCLELLNYEKALVIAIKAKQINSVFELLKRIPGIGDFLASQVCFDFLWHRCCNEWHQLQVLGVGAIRGANKLGLIGTLKPTRNDSRGAISTAYDYVIDGYPFIRANGVAILPNVADIQNTFCESDKYLRLVRHDIKISDKAPTRIKNVYKPGMSIDYVVPGHWVGTNEDLVGIDR